MSNIAVLVAIWAFAFAILVVPARPIGKWMARQGDGPIHAVLNIFICLVIAFNVADQPPYQSKRRDVCS
jgi:hypothetical protein